MGDAYGAMLSRLKRQDGDKVRLGIAALMWISHAERPLEADELCHALSVEVGSPNLNTDNVPSIGTLLTCCQGLVVVEKEASTVRLIHFTLQEYLRAQTDLFGAADSTIAETCLSYLNSQQVKAISTSPSPSLQHAPFLEYSSLCWGVHTKRGLSHCAKQLALKLFDDCNSHISTKILLRAHDVWGVKMDKVSQFGGLHCACLFGIVEIVAGLVEIEGCNINQIDFTGSTPLYWAARSGDVGVVKALLGRGSLSLDTPDVNGDTPLHVAACFAREDVMKILLQQNINPHKPNFNGQTAFHHAAARGYEGIVKMLLEQDGVNPDGSDVFGQTPLWAAAQNGHEGMVKLLLGLDCVNPNKLGMYGLTPLDQATANGYQRVIALLQPPQSAAPNFS